jgi:hypothetical protein
MNFVRRKSGRQDLNLRPPGPKPGALAKLSYAPCFLQFPLTPKYRLRPVAAATALAELSYARATPLAF